MYMRLEVQCSQRHSHQCVSVWMTADAGGDVDVDVKLTDHQTRH